MPAIKFEDLSSFLRNLWSEKACIYKLFSDCVVCTQTHKHGKGGLECSPDSSGMLAVFVVLFLLLRQHILTLTTKHLRKGLVQLLIPGYSSLFWGGQGRSLTSQSHFITSSIKSKENKCIFACLQLAFSSQNPQSRECFPQWVGSSTSINNQDTPLLPNLIQ